MAITVPTCHWKLADTSEELAGQTLTNNASVTFGTGKIGNCAEFTADNMNLSRATSATLETGDIDFAFTMWVQFQAFETNDRVVCKIDGTTREYDLFIPNGAVPRPGFRVGASGQAVWSGDLSVDTWYLIAFGHSATNSVNWISVNAGTRVTAADSPVAAGTSTFRIGGDTTEGWTRMKGDELSFWKNYDLTAAEITEIYNAGSGLSFPFPTGAGAGSFTRSSLIRPSYLKKEK